MELLRYAPHMNTKKFYGIKFMELLRYAPHMNTKKLWVNKFVYELNYNIKSKFQILMPCTLHVAI
jgi:hypothetical protein